LVVIERGAIAATVKVERREASSRLLVNGDRGLGRVAVCEVDQEDEVLDSLRVSAGRSLALSARNVGCVSRPESIYFSFFYFYFPWRWHCLSLFVIV